MNKTIFISCCSPEYLSKFKVLYNSIKTYISDVDTILYYGDSNLPSDVGTAVDVSPWVKESPYSDPFYTYCHIRPKAVLDAFSRGYEKVILLGSDTEFFDYPKEMLTKLDDNQMVVTLYRTEPYEDAPDNVFGNDFQVFINGQIQADFIGFSKSPETIKFLEYIVKQTKTKCKVDNTVMVDQGWLSLCFSFLDKVGIIRNLGYNVGSYNAIDYGLCKKTWYYLGGYVKELWTMRDGSRLVLYHYDGFEKGKEEKISKHQSRFTATGEYLEFLKEYGEKI